MSFTELHSMQTPNSWHPGAVAASPFQPHPWPGTPARNPTQPGFHVSSPPPVSPPPVPSRFQSPPPVGYSMHPSTPATLMYQPPYSQPLPPLRKHNATDLTPEMLRLLLDHLSTQLAAPHAFNGARVTLIVHGGAVFLLHPKLSQLAKDLENEGTRYAASHAYSAQGTTDALDKLGLFPRRTTTRDVDYIARAFNEQWAAQGIYDANERLRKCTKDTAYAFHHLSIGDDWVNSDADISLPMAIDPETGMQYDPIATAASQPNNVDLYTVYESPNKILTLVAVSPAWAIALKIVRYGPRDWADVSLILRNGSYVRWSADTVERWLRSQCSAMLFDHRDERTKQEIRKRIEHAVDMFQKGKAASEAGHIDATSFSRRSRTEPPDLRHQSRTHTPFTPDKNAEWYRSSSPNDIDTDAETTEESENEAIHQRSYRRHAHHERRSHPPLRSHSTTDSFLSPPLRPFIPPDVADGAYDLPSSAHYESKKKKGKKSDGKKRDRNRQRASDRQAKHDVLAPGLQYDLEDSAPGWNHVASNQNFPPPASREHTPHRVEPQIQDSSWRSSSLKSSIYDMSKVQQHLTSMSLSGTHPQIEDREPSHPRRQGIRPSRSTPAPTNTLGLLNFA